MPSAPAADNCLVIAGQLAGTCETRISPAGIPISRFFLEHHSGQTEAGTPREARCRIAVMACGEGLSRVVGQLPSGTAVRVRGFLSRANHRAGEYRLVLHAAHIEQIASATPVRPESS
jgi:primosomal replication protein N